MAVKCCTFPAPASDGKLLHGRSSICPLGRIPVGSIFKLLLVRKRRCVRMRCSMKYICRHAHAIFCCSSTKLVVWTTDTGIPRDDSDSAVKSWRPRDRKIHSEETYILLCLRLHSTSEAKYLQHKVPTSSSPSLSLCASEHCCFLRSLHQRERE